jgi:MoaA/NifB/PqqE/SkfB family radical SAM enzyme
MNFLKIMVSLKNSNLLYRFITFLLFNDFLRIILLRYLKGKISSYLETNKKSRFYNSCKSIQEQKILMIDSILHSVEESIKKGILKKDAVEVIAGLWSKSLIIPRQNNSGVTEFHEKYHCDPPWFLVISPGHYCNLKCRDCYASSETISSKLEWDILDQLVKDVKKTWGIKLIVFSGGEPFAYFSDGRGIMEIAKENPDCLFLSFTNGTLIDKKTILKLSECKNLTPAFSVEGLRETTDKRRGRGTFNRVLKSMSLMRDAGLPFGISVTVNKYNCSSVLDDKFLDFFFKEQGIFYSFFFQYLPIGRNPNFDLMPTASQRVDFYNKIWNKIEKKRYFLIDFWNHGPLVNGCIAAGRDGGYFYIYYSFINIYYFPIRACGCQGVW